MWFNNQSRRCLRLTPLKPQSRFGDKLLGSSPERDCGSKRVKGRQSGTCTKAPGVTRVSCKSCGVAFHPLLLNHSLICCLSGQRCVQVVGVFTLGAPPRAPAHLPGCDMTQRIQVLMLGIPRAYVGMEHTTAASRGGKKSMNLPEKNSAEHPLHIETPLLYVDLLWRRRQK